MFNTSRTCRVTVRNFTEIKLGKVAKREIFHGALVDGSALPVFLKPQSIETFSLASRFGGMTTTGVSGALEFVSEDSSVRLKLKFEYPVVGNLVFRGQFSPRKLYVVDVQFKRISASVVDVEFVLVNIATETVFYPIALQPPLLVLINRKSGGKQGAPLLERFKEILPSSQVVDILQCGPERALEHFKKVPDLRILVCGGDGTAKWVAEAMDAVHSVNPLLKPGEAFVRPPMAVLPLGTGNDIARVLGWGPGYNNEPLDKIIAETLKAKPVQIDRWDVKVKSFDGSETVQHVFNNYLSIGFVDAKVALDFHSMRDENPGLFFNRTVNKFWYAAYGGKVSIEQLFQSSRDLSHILDVEIDGQAINISTLKLEGIVVLNIPTYAGGTNLWGMRTQPEFKRVSFSDGAIEVIGITSLSHFASIKAGITEGLRLGQGRNVIFQYKDATRPLPGKIDGEPWLQTKAAQYEIKYVSADFMLARKTSCGDRSFGSRRVGYLKKKVDLIWKPRFFVISDRMLTYYIGAEDVKPRGQIDLTKSIISMGKLEGEVLIKTQDRVYSFLCQDFGEKVSEWVADCVAEASKVSAKEIEEDLEDSLLIDDDRE